MSVSIALRSAALGAGLVGLAACAEMPGAGGGDPAPGGADASGSCGAAERQDLVGTSIGALDAATLPEDRRVIFPGMAVTMDYREDRLNVEVGADDRIARVFCG
jgi:hypothetical protein